MVKCMLKVLMDGIKDAEMMIDYAYQAHDMENVEMKTWFTNHAIKRTEMVESDFAFIKNKLGMAEKIRNGDVIAEALYDHLDDQVKSLKADLMELGR